MFLRANCLSVGTNTKEAKHTEKESEEGERDRESYVTGMTSQEVSSWVCVCACDFVWSIGFVYVIFASVCLWASQSTWRRFLFFFSLEGKSMSSLTQGLQLPVCIRWRCEFAISGLVLSYSKTLVWVLKYTGKEKTSLLTCNSRGFIIKSVG